MIINQRFAGMFNLSERDISLLEREFFSGGRDEIRYDEFITKLTHHADSVVRSKCTHCYKDNGVVVRAYHNHHQLCSIDVPKTV